MKFDNIFCSVEQSKAIEAHGITKAFYTWILNTNTGRFTISQCDAATLTAMELKDQMGRTFHPAFTASELGAMLPDDLVFIKTGKQNAITGYKANYPFPDIMEKCNMFSITSEISEADARAQMVLKMLDREYITAEDCNTRLNS